MSENTHDPIRDLQNFGTGGLGVDPLEPALVRRLGDKRRTRRRASLAAAASVLAVAAAVVPVTLTMTDDTTPPAPLVTPTPTPPETPSPTPTPTPSAPEPDPVTVTYPGDDDVPGTRITGSADLPRLRGSSEDFQAFVLEVLSTLKGDPDCADSDLAGSGDRRPLVVVERYSSAGYAVGSTGGCEGHSALWTKTGGTWSEAIGTHEIWSCAALDEAGVPVSFVGGCYGEDGDVVVGGDFGPTAVDGIKIGMTPTQVGSVGASVVAGPSRCDYLFQSSSEPPPEGSDIADTDGFVSEGKVVAIRALSSHRTPEGIGNGSGRPDVEAAYPGGAYEPHPATGGYWVAPLANGNQYRFYLSPRGTTGPDVVILMELSRPGASCLF